LHVLDDGKLKRLGIVDIENNDRDVVSAGTLAMISK
jgi:hypothetical protein